ncbi:MAG: sigma-54 interaction domain-containing protein [bacterium]
MCLLWIAEKDRLHTSTLNGGHNVVHTKSLANFLAGYYYRFIRFGSNLTPYLIEDLHKVEQLPPNLLKLAEIENITTIFIAPVFSKKHVKGTIILGTANVDYFRNIDYALLTLLTDAALNLTNAKERAFPCQEAMRNLNRFGSIIGRSPQMQELYKTIIKVSRSSANVFIYGESGTGKELVARTIHAQSQRKNQAFIPLDCVALPRSLLESELFGYEKGAFTGANNLKRGLIEYADQGTIFLDEITELHIELQAKLLRVLQEMQFRRIGGKDLIDIDVRIISATNCDPQEAVLNRKLREDLFYRLNVIPIFIPPLRERKEDIPLLVEHTVGELCKSNDRKRCAISDEAIEYLMNYGWPGNIRELKNLIERLLTLADQDTISIKDLPAEMTTNRVVNATPEYKNAVILPYNKAKQQNIKTFERQYFSRLLDRYNGNISKVAKEAEVSRKTIYNILHKHDPGNSLILGKPLYSN